MTPRPAWRHQVQLRTACFWMEAELMILISRTNGWNFRHTSQHSVWSICSPILPWGDSVVPGLFPVSGVGRLSLQRKDCYTLHGRLSGDVFSVLFFYPQFCGVPVSVQVFSPTVGTESGALLPNTPVDSLCTLDVMNCCARCLTTPQPCERPCVWTEDVQLRLDMCSVWRDQN